MAAADYSVLKATLTFEAVSLGNCPEVELTPEFEILDHFSSQTGVKSIDKSVTVSQKLSLRIVMDEWTAHNVKLAMMANPTGSPINVYSQAEREGEIIITGTNTVGNTHTWTFPSVSFQPTSSINLISEEWATMEITGTVNSVAGVFGTMVET